MCQSTNVPHVTQVLSKSHSWRWPISPLFSVTASSSCCLKHNRRSEGVVKSEAPETVARGPENINLEIAVISMANIVNSRDLREVQVRIHSTFEINVGSDSLRFSPTLNLDSH